MNSIIYVIIVVIWGAIAVKQLLNQEDKDISRHIGILLISNIMLTLLGIHFN